MTREKALFEAKNVLDEATAYEDAVCYVTGDDREWLDMAIEALEQEPCGDAISRKSIKQKLQEHHDFFVNAYGGFSNLPQNDKSRVDEITNCIAMVVNEPSITPQPKIGRWITKDGKEQGYDISGVKTWYIQIMCSECGFIETAIEGHTGQYHYCPNCGAKMEEE